MIDITKLNEDDIGKFVVYELIKNKLNIGRIKSWNDEFIFVVYHCDGDWANYKDYTGCSTNPDDLSFVRDFMIGNHYQK